MKTKYTVVATWIGQDGNEWKELSVCLGTPDYRYFMQRKLSNCVWKIK
jgi:hypothetical protein